MTWTSLRQKRSSRQKKNTVYVTQSCVIYIKNVDKIVIGYFSVE
jgi:hypothetical protein